MHWGPTIQSLPRCDGTETLLLWLPGHLVGYAVALDISISGKKTLITEDVEHSGCKMNQGNWYLNYDEFDQLSQDRSPYSIILKEAALANISLFGMKSASPSAHCTSFE